MINRNPWIIFAATMVLIGLLALAYGCQQEGTSPEEQLAQQAGSSAPAAAPPSPPPGSGQSGTATPGGVAAPPAAGSAPPAAGTPPATGTPPETGATPPSAPGSAGTGAPGATQAPPAKSGAAAEAAPPEAGKKEEAKGEGTAEDPAITNFKNLDPRTIIDKKYEDLKDKETEPWNMETPELFIPETGRVDPLTPVDSAVPDELKPPRTGSTDENQIDTYLISQACSAVIEQVSTMLRVYNVIQIGLFKFASISIGGDRGFPVQEGFSVDVPIGVVNGAAISLNITCSSISTKEVVIVLTASAQGTTTSVSKTMTYIPNTF